MYMYNEHKRCICVGCFDLVLCKTIIYCGNSHSMLRTTAAFTGLSTDISRQQFIVHTLNEDQLYSNQNVP